MDIATILVNFDVDAFSPTLARCVGNLARRFDADVIGVAAAEPPLVTTGFDGGLAATTLYTEQRAEIEERLVGMEAQFRAALGPDIDARWLGGASNATRLVLELGRSADLIVAGSSQPGESHYLPTLDVGQVVLAAGRPVLVAGAGVETIAANKVVVGWKDVRECRRALTDAMPFLRRASETLVAVVDEGEQAAQKQGLNDVLAWLAKHGITARGEVFPNTNGLGATLEQVRKDAGADLVVTGGYGHSRMREWLFGGMTLDLLQAPSMNRFMSN